VRYREVIDVPPPPPVEVTEHRIYKGWCAGCQHWYEAPMDMHEQVVGQGRIGVRLASLIASARHGDATAHSTDSGVPAHAAWDQD
jgi:transposase